MGSLLGNGLGRLFHERRVHDPLEGNRALHESVLRPPRHLPLDVRHEQAGVAVLIGEAEPDHLGLGLRILRRDAQDFVVVGAGRGLAVLLDEDGVVVVARGLDVALHKGDGKATARCRSAANFLEKNTATVCHGWRSPAQNKILPKPCASAVPGKGCGSMMASTCLPLRASMAAGMIWSGTTRTSASLRPDFSRMLPRE